MSKKSNNNNDKITIPSEVHYTNNNEDEDEDHSITEQDNLECSLVLDDDTVLDLDPTITEQSDSSLDSDTKPIKKRTRRSKAAMSVFSRARKEEQARKNKLLRISEKRRLAHEVLRTLQRNESLLDKVVKYFVTNDLLIDPVKQKLNFNLQVNNKTNDVTVIINFNIHDNTDLSQGTILSGLKNKLSNLNSIRVLPVPTKNSEKEVSFSIQQKMILTTSNKSLL